MDGDETQHLRMRLQQLELQQAQLKREKEIAEREFGQQRSKFKDILMMREGEIAQQQTTSQTVYDQYQRDVIDLRSRLGEATSEAKSFQQMTDALEVSNKLELEEQRHQHQEEITSMRHILEVSAEETAHQNREMWLVERHQLEAEISRLRTQPPGNGGGSSATSATVAVPTSSHRSTLLPTLLKRAAVEEPSDASAKVSRDADRSSGGAASADKNDVPQLKEKLRDSRAKIKALQRQLDAVTKSAESKRNGLFGGLFNSSAASTESKLSSEELLKQQSLQSCSRQDLEMFVSALMAQKGVLQDENTDLRGQLDKKQAAVARANVSPPFNVPTTAGGGGDVVADLLNLDPVITSSLSDVPLIPLATATDCSVIATATDCSVVSSTPIDHVSVASGTSTTLATGTSMDRMLGYAGDIASTSLDTNDMSMASGDWSGVSAQSSQHSLRSHALHRGNAANSMECSVDGVSIGDVSQWSVDGGVVAAVQQGRSNDSDSLLDVDFGSPAATSCMAQAHRMPSGHDVIASHSQHHVATASSSTSLMSLASGPSAVNMSASVQSPLCRTTSMPSNVTPTSSGCDAVAATAATVASGSPAVRGGQVAAAAAVRGCARCEQLRGTVEQKTASLASVEDKIELLEMQIAVLESKKLELENTVDRLTRDLDVARVNFQQLHEQYSGISEEVHLRLEGFDIEQSASATMCEELRQSYSLLRVDSNVHVDKLQEEYSRLKFRLTSLSETGSQRETILSREASQIKALLDLEKKAHATTGSHRDALQREIETHATTEDELRTEVMLLQNRLQTETFAKESVEVSLQNQLQDAHLEIGELRSAMDHESSMKKETLAGASAAESHWQHLHSKAADSITVLERHLSQEKTAKEALTLRVQEQRGQLENLRGQLNSTEEVSHDFVRLSQNLQVRLAEMAAQQRELRWEHDDDVTACRACAKGFAPTVKKHHCRQCGKIFCADCSSKTVQRTAGSRPLRVCAECHDLLNSESAAVVLPSDATTSAALG